MINIEVENCFEDIKNYNINDFKSLLKNVNYRVDDSKSLFFKCIEEDIPFEKIKLFLRYNEYLLDQFSYDGYRYKNYENICPLVFSIIKHRFEVADFLIENGMDINSLSLNCLNEAFKSKYSRYLLYKGLEISETLILHLIENKMNNFLEYILKYNLYDNDFILKLLYLYRTKTDIPTMEQFNELVNNKMNKVRITNSMFNTAIKYDNSEAIEILEKYNYTEEIIKRYIRNNNYKEFKNFITKEKINLSNYSNKYDMNRDLLFYSIQHHSSQKIMDIIIQECQYESLNFDVCVNEQILPLLFALLYRYNFKTFDYLIKKNADINHPRIEGNRSIDYRRIVSILYENEDYRNKTIKYIFNSQFKIDREMIRGWIERKQIKLLKKILSIYFFNNTFILKLLSIYKGKKPMSNKQLYHIIHEEYKKTSFSINHYIDALQYSSCWEAINLLYHFDHRDKTIILGELFNIFHDDEKTNQSGKKFLFIKKINQNQLNIKTNKVFLENLECSAENEEQLLNFIDRGQTTELKNFLKSKELSIDYFNNESFDFLIYAIENYRSLKMIEFLISQYSTLNYSIKKGNKDYCSPLISSISHNNSRVFQLLIKSGADINYKINGETLINELINKKLFNPRRLIYLLNHGLIMDSDVISSLKNIKSGPSFHNYFKILFDYYVYDNSYIINLILISKQKIPHSSLELDEVIHRKGKKMKFNIDYDWLCSGFNVNKILLHNFLDIGKYHYFSPLSKTESNKILRRALDDGEMIFIEKFLKSPLFDMNSFQLDEFLSEEFFNGDLLCESREQSQRMTSFNSKKSNKLSCYKCERLYYLMFLINKLFHCSSFDLKVSSFEKIISNGKLPCSFLNFLIEKFLKQESLKNETINFENFFKNIYENAMYTESLKTIYENILNHKSFDFKKYENVLLEIVFKKTFKEKIDKVSFPVIEMTFHHPTFDFRTLNTEKMIAAYYKDEDSYFLINLILEELFNLENYRVKHFDISNILLQILQHMRFNKYSISYSIIDRFFEHETFIINDSIKIYDILFLSMKIKSINPPETDEKLKNNKVSEYLVEKLLRHETFKFSYENVELILLSIVRLINIFNDSNNNGINNNNMSSIETLMKQIFNSKKFQKSSIDLHCINYQKILLKSSYNSNLLMTRWIFKNVVNEVDLKLMKFESILLSASKMDNIKLMKFLVEKLLNITSDANLIDPTFMSSLLLKFKEIDRPHLTLIINIFLKLNYQKLIKVLLENEELKSIIDINIKDKNNEYPLLVISNYNCYNRTIDLFEYFLTHGANMYIEDKNEFSLFRNALKNSNYSILNCLFRHQISIEKEIENRLRHKNDINASEIIQAIYYNKIDIIKDIISRKKEIISNNDGKLNSLCSFTPLTLSYLLERFEIFKILIENSTLDQLNELDGNGYSILHYSILKNDRETFLYLSHKGVNYKKNGYIMGHSILDMSIYLKDSLLFSYILNSSKKNDSMNEINRQGDSLIHTLLKISKYSIEEKVKWISFLLKKKNFIINHLDQKGKSVLYYASKLQSKPLIKLLIKNGADLNINEISSSYPKNRSTLYYIIKNCDHSIIRYIAKHYPKKFTSDIIKEIFKMKNLELIKLLFPNLIDILHENSDVIFYAIETDDIKIVEYILDCTTYLVDTNAILRKIMHQNNLEILKLFIPKYFDYNMKDKYGMTALYHAIDLGRGKIASYLIEKGALLEELTLSDDFGYMTIDLNQYMNDMKTKFIDNDDFYLNPESINDSEVIKHAVDTNNTSTIEYFIDQGHDLNGFSDYEPVSHAIKNGNLEMVKFLTEKGANINKKDRNGYTPIMNAIERHDLSIIDYLMEKGSNIKAIVEEEFPFGKIIIKKYGSRNQFYNYIIDKYLIEAYSGEKFWNSNYELFIRQVIDGDNRKLFKLIIDHHSDLLKKPTETMESLLFYAFKEGKNNILDYAIKNIDFDVNYKNENDTSLLFCAIKNENEALVKYLVEKGANINIETKWGDNPLIYSMKIGNIKIIEYLISKGAIIDDYYNSSSDILHRYKAKDKKLLKYLIDRNYSKINNKRVNSSLIISIKANNLEMVKYAIEKYAIEEYDKDNINICDEYNKNSLIYAIVNSNGNIMEFINQHMKILIFE